MVPPEVAASRRQARLGGPELYDDSHTQRKLAWAYYFEVDRINNNEERSHRAVVIPAAGPIEEVLTLCYAHVRPLLAALAE